MFRYYNGLRTEIFKMTMDYRELTCDVVSLEHISQILSTSESVFLAWSSCEACIMGSRQGCAPQSCILLSRIHCSKWDRLYLKAEDNSHIVCGESQMKM